MILEYEECPKCWGEGDIKQYDKETNELKYITCRKCGGSGIILKSKPKELNNERT